MRNTYAENTMGTRIREMRKAAGMSQEQLAEYVMQEESFDDEFEEGTI